MVPTTSLNASCFLVRAWCTALISKRSCRGSSFTSTVVSPFTKPQSSQRDDGIFTIDNGFYYFCHCVFIQAWYIPLLLPEAAEVAALLPLLSLLSPDRNLVIDMAPFWLSVTVSVISPLMKYKTRVLNIDYEDSIYRVENLEKGNKDGVCKQNHRLLLTTQGFKGISHS